jgi:hypothetical protein
METLWDKLLFWKKKPKMLKEGIDFEFVEFKESDLTGIGLLLPEYKGVLYHYHRAKVVEEGELARLQFGYTIVNSGEHDIDDLTKDEKLHTIMGEILTELITSKRYNEQTRTDDSQESDLQ